MKLNILSDFEMRDITRIGDWKVLEIDEDHYIGAFLSTGCIAPKRRLSGERYKYMDGVDSDNLSFKNLTVISEVELDADSPTAPVTQAYRYADLIVIENKNLDSSFEVYVGDDKVAEITDCGVRDGLVLLTDLDINPTELHSKSIHPHIDGTYITPSVMAGVHSEPYDKNVYKEIDPIFEGYSSIMSNNKSVGFYFDDSGNLVNTK